MGNNPGNNDIRFNITGAEESRRDLNILEKAFLSLVDRIKDFRSVADAPISITPIASGSLDSATPGAVADVPQQTLGNTGQFLEQIGQLGQSLPVANEELGALTQGVS